MPKMQLRTIEMSRDQIHTILKGLKMLPSGNSDDDAMDSPVALSAMFKAALEEEDDVVHCFTL